MLYGPIWLRRFIWGPTAYILVGKQENFDNAWSGGLILLGTWWRLSQHTEIKRLMYVSIIEKRCCRSIQTFNALEMSLLSKKSNFLCH